MRIPRANNSPLDFILKLTATDHEAELVREPALPRQNYAPLPATSTANQYESHNC